MTLGIHRMTKDRLVEQTLLKIEIENKVNDMLIKVSFKEVFIADTSNIISKFTVRY